MRRLTIAVALLAASLPAAAQPQADPLDEPLCIYAEMLAAARVHTTPDPATLRATCKARYHWDDAATQRAYVIAVTLITYQEAGRDAVAAGVDPAIVDAVFQSLTPEQVAAFGTLDSPVTDGTRAVIGIITSRLSARGLSGDALKKAFSMISARALGANLITEFQRLRGTAK